MIPETSWGDTNLVSLSRITKGLPNIGGGPTGAPGRGEHEGEELYEFVLTDEKGRDIELGMPVIAWANDEGSARESAWDMVEYLLYADAEDLEYHIEDFMPLNIERDDDR